MALGTLLFGTAGTIDAPIPWIYLAMMALLCALALVLVYLRSPDLLREKLSCSGFDSVAAWLLAAAPVAKNLYSVRVLAPGEFAVERP